MKTGKFFYKMFGLALLSLISGFWLLAVGTALADEPPELPSFSCGEPAVFQPEVKAKLKARSPNRTVRKLVLYHMFAWDLAYKRKACERVLAGEKNVYIGCLTGHRNWDEIDEMVPDDLLALPRTELRSEVNKLPSMMEERHATGDFCVENGVTAGFRLR